MSVLSTVRDGAILRVTLTRPEVRNAFDEEVIAQLTACARTAVKDPTLRAVVLAGEGKAFCAGADLAWMMKAIAYSRQDNLRDAEDLARMLELLDTMPVPLVGRVQGSAFGGGAGLVAVCDIVAAVSPYVVSKIGTAAARELFLTGARFTAERAREIGLVHAVVPEAELDSTIFGYLREILTSAPGATAAAKALIRDVHGKRSSEVVGLTTNRIADQRVSAEGQEGMRAFLEKRKPDWVD